MTKLLINYLIYRIMTQITENSKLIVVTRRDLIPGSQSVQASHALIKFIFEHSEISKEWYNTSEYLVKLSVNNQEELLELAEKLRWKEILFSEFREPDLDNELTAIALEPTNRARRVVSSMPLLLSEYNEHHRKEVEHEK